MDLLSKLNFHRNYRNDHRSNTSKGQEIGAHRLGFPFDLLSDLHVNYGFVKNSPRDLSGYMESYCWFRLFRARLLTSRYAEGDVVPKVTYWADKRSSVAC